MSGPAGCHPCLLREGAVFRWADFTRVPESDFRAAGVSLYLQTCWSRGLCVPSSLNWVCHWINIDGELRDKSFKKAESL